MHRSTKKNTELFTLGHSPDPDDAFMFYAMAENKIDLRGYRFHHRLEDIQTLNERARRGELHISAISIHAYAYVSDRYALMPCGASMGDGYGPILVRKIPNPKSQVPITDKHRTSNIPLDKLGALSLSKREHQTSNASTVQRFNAST